MIQIMKWAVAIGTLSATAALAAEEPPRIAINLNSYSQVEIDRPASAVWPYILDLNSWKTERKLTHYSGPVNRVGEVFAIMGVDPRNPNAPKRIWFLCEEVERAPNERRTLKMYDPAGNLQGYVTWILRESGSHTIVENHLHGESRIAPDKAAKMTPEDVAQQQRQGYDSNKNRIDAELQVLKHMVEAK